ncbi:MAG: hypothetical protein AB7V55_06410 [Oscillospiraceae bacterium]
MDELQREYTLLFNGITDTLKQLERIKTSLIKLQQDAEESHLDRVCAKDEQAPSAFDGAETPGDTHPDDPPL